MRLGSLVFNEYIRIFQIYKIIIIMLEKKSNLTLREQNMLQVTKQRSQCLGDILADLSNNPEKSIEEKVIVDERNISKRLLVVKQKMKHLVMTKVVGNDWFTQINKK